MQKYIETRWLSEENCILRLLERWNELIDFLKNEDNKDSKEIIEHLNNETKVYFQFLTIFLKDVNAVNILFQKREALVTKIQEETIDLFNITINLILLDDYRTLNLREKLKLLEYIKDSKTVKIDAKFLKDTSLFRKHILSIYKTKSVGIASKKFQKLEEIAKNMIKYIKSSVIK